MPSYWYRKSHCEDKAILRPSYLHNGISYTGKTTSLYWIRALVAIGGSQEVQWLTWCHSQLVHRMLRHSHGHEGRHKVLNAQTSSRRLVALKIAQMRQKGGTCITMVAEWIYNDPLVATMQKICSVTKHDPKSGRCICLPCASTFGQPMWRLQCVHSVIMATPEQPWQWFFLPSASFEWSAVPLLSAYNTLKPR